MIFLIDNQIRILVLKFWEKDLPLHQGKSYTASSQRIPQVLIEARVFG